jgi:predicted CXXCH cytochrome family protein
VVLACGAALGQEARPFSHRLHLKLKPDCTSCHAAAPSSTTAQQNLLPAKEACGGCHQTVTIKQPSPTGVSKFNHQLHLKLGNVAPVIAAAIKSKTYLSEPGNTLAHLNTKNVCAGCHRGLEQSDAVSMAAFPRMADCLVCHNKIEPPFSCEKCHTAGIDLRPPSHHISGFFDHHSSGKANFDRTSCAVCHGRQFTCLGCH